MQEKRLEVGDEGPGIRTAETADVPRLTAMLARAFYDDPVLNWWIRPNAREESLSIFFDRALALTLPGGLVFTTTGHEGASLWSAPGQWKFGLLKQMSMLGAIFKAAGLARLHKVIFSLNEMQSLHPSVPHYYLLVVGVDPSSQGQGIGGRLLNHMLRKCDEEGVGAYLENSKEENVVFYERHGFQVTKELRLGGTGPRVWLQWRKPSESIRR